MPAQFGGYDTLRSFAGKVFTYLSTITLTGVDGKTLTLNDNTILYGKVLPSFLVKPTAEQTNLAVGSDVDIVWGTEIKDLAGNFAANVFTAPVSGLYQLSFNIYMTNVDSASTFTSMTILTSNRGYMQAMPFNLLSGDGSFTWNLSILADMDAGDTAKVQFYQATGTQQADVNAASHFSGALIAPY